MTALLMRWEVILANFVVFCNRSNFCHPWGLQCRAYMLPRVKKVIIVGPVLFL